MNTKLLLLLTWLFYLMGKDGPDHVWLFCAILGASLTVCSFFHQLDNRHEKPKKKTS